LVRLFTDRFILTPGPTEVPERIRLAMAAEPTNPDLDPEFASLYKGVVSKLRKLLGASRSDVYVMVGEAMLGLEAAIANLVKRGDKVLVVANGVFGEGFADLVRMYGGEPVMLESDWRRAVDPSDVERALERNPGVKLLTIVHCDTPSAILNPLRDVAKVAKERGVLVIADAVSSIGGVPVDVDGWGVDVLIGGSQKVLNVPPGLTIITVSPAAWEEAERVGYKGFYLDIKLWKRMVDEEGVFPYTVSDPLIRGLDEALSMLFEEGIENVYERHIMARKAAWAALEAANLEPYPQALEHSSPTVTAALVPKGIDEAELRRITWEKYGVMIAGSWGKLQGKVVRIGHMGVQASRTHLIVGFTALARALKDLGYQVDVGKVVEALEEVYS
jgi:alanine-glyoxylate transaminase/serine-glyoxylate transaminase/serine-pyruvate transaminase